MIYIRNVPYDPKNFLYKNVYKLKNKYIHMNKSEKIKKIDELRTKAAELKLEVDYYNASQLALKLVLN
jgi:hypothetical protein